MHARSLAILLVSTLAALAQDVPAPEQHFGFVLGTDRRLLDWDELTAYYRLVAGRSPRVHLESLGRTTEGREMIAVVVSGRPAAELPAIQERQRRLARGELSPEELARAVEDQPTVVVVQATLHSTEIAASLLVPDLVHRFATGDDEDTRRLLQDVLLVIVPSANPDGLDRVVAWYRRSLGTPWEGSSPPELYHRYAGHDNNRDWFMLSLEETRLVTRLLYEEWLPAVFLDVHQMGSRGARIFVPPFADPLNPNVPPLLSRQLDFMGACMALALAREGLSGVVQDVVFDGWWNGGARSVPVRHNMVGLLTETASARLASPLWIEARDLRGHGRGLPEYRAQGNFPDPWPGGWWRLADILRYQRVSTLAVIDAAATHRRLFVEGFHRLARDAIEAGRRGPPYAFLLPAAAGDRGALARLLRNLLATGVQVFEAGRAFTCDGRRHEAGTWVIPAAQPFRPHLKDLLEPQVYPGLRLEEGGRIVTPYDASGWTLPLQFGLECVAAREPVPNASGLLARTAIPDPPSTIEIPEGPARGWFLHPEANAAHRFLNRVVRAGVRVRRASRGGREGFFVESEDGAALAAKAEGLGLHLEAVPADEELALGARAAVPRVGIYMPVPGSMDAGWTRLVLEEHGFEPAMIDAASVRSGGLREQIDVLVLADIGRKTLEDGPEDGAVPPDLADGLGRAGADALRAFVEGGGRVLAFAKAVDFVAPLLDLPLTREEPPKDAAGRPFVVCPGSLLQVEAVDGPSAAEVLRAGLPRTLAVYQDHGGALAVPDGAAAGDSVAMVLRYPDRDPLLSGHLEGGEALAGRGLMAVARRGAGDAVLYAFRPQHRSQTLGTFRLVFNALWRDAP